ncbi:cobalt ECF transporter T component CbiQ [Alkaliphilus hydrothermalis]|uniref:Cobalt/nickel transport system permease protein n=1 Tax=Alkaliphilus hydrothermalis TaxID=1482730 RepID=A0ABS2NN43_9FIRM|nr:cobalt ECF transporter T component CbiQ [Alkaliphilus hydrothermalis]MBM7614353.1 cobalt/nickel transport system permease protein [Alkaliphilus hydrothermalis]
MIVIDQYAYTNGLKEIHPLEKFILALMSLIICLFTKSTLLHLIIFIVMSTIIIGIAKIPFSTYLKIMLIPLAFLGISCFGVAFIITKNPLILTYGIGLGSWFIGFSLEGIQSARILFFRAYSSIGCMYFLALTTPMIDIIWVLRKIKLPSILTDLMIIIYRFIFVLLETASLIYISQDSRLGYSSIKRSYVSLGGLISNLFFKVFLRSKELFISLTARGYTGDFNVLEEAKVLSFTHILMIAFLEVIFIVLAFIL